MLEVDHIVPVARGGLNTLENLTLKCRHHNQWRAIQMFGEKHMEQYGQRTGNHNSNKFLSV